MPIHFHPLHSGRVLAVSVVMLAALSGCTLGPDYRRPSVEEQLPAKFDLPEGWKVAEPRDDEALTKWWQSLGDERFDRLVERALTNNQDLTAAFYRVEQSRAVLDASLSGRVPRIDFEPAVERRRRSATTRNISSNITGTTTNNFVLPLLLDYEVDLWGRVRRGIEAAEAETLASESAFRQVSLTLQTELASQYFNLRSIDTEISIFQEAVSNRKRFLDLNRKRFEAGDTDEVDVSRAETELSAAESELIGLRQQRSEFENAIAVLVGIPSPEFDLDIKPLTSTPPRIPVSIPTELLERRPDIANAERIMIAENARIGVAKAAFFPTVKINATLGLESATTAQLFNYASHIWAVGPMLSVPVFDGGLNRAELARSQARYEESVADYRQTILQAVREVDDALVAIKRLEERAAAQQRTVSSAGRTVELSRTRYEAGVVAYFEVVDAQRTELDARQMAARLRVARYSALVSLIKALGGGWN